MSSENKSLEQKCKQLNLEGYQRHIFLCVGPKCLNQESGELIWQKLKNLCSEHGIVNKTVCRTKANCLRVCEHGAVAVVYPDGVWYKGVDLNNIETIVKEHLIHGRVVQDLVLAVNKNS